MSINLYEHQKEAIDKMHNGCILCGNVGSGKSITALAYYFIKVCKGCLKINGVGKFKEMEEPRDLYIITTARKRDSLDWEKECLYFNINKNPELSINNVRVIVDSWNNIKKYKDVYGAFFIFDEQRVVGHGVWVKTFLNISRKNKWILLSATPGDTWSDYIPVFVANGFYKNKTEFSRKHIIYKRFSKYPMIDRYIEQGTLMKHKSDILVNMKDKRHTIRHDIAVLCKYDKNNYKKVWKDYWNIFDDEPIEESSKRIYVLRRVVNTDDSRIKEFVNILNKHNKIIVFYNFNYELELLKNTLESLNIEYGEVNGHKHDDLPNGDKWCYLVQYLAGAEAWNCITTNVILFYSQNYSYKILEQSRGRIDRINTPYTDLYYYHMRSSAPIDLAINRSLKDKKEFNERKFLQNY